MKSKSLLIVDDNPANLKLLGLLLRADGYSVKTAESATDALKLLSSYTPDLILMDIQMPGVNGLQLTRILKSDPRTMNITVLAVSANAMKMSIEEARAAGCEGYVTKPIDTRTFASTVRAYIDRKDGAPMNVEEEPPDGAVQSLAAACSEQLGLFLNASGTSDRTAVSEVLHRCAGVARAAGQPGITELSGQLETRSPTLTEPELTAELSKLQRRFAEAGSAGLLTGSEGLTE